MNTVNYVASFLYILLCVLYIKRVFTYFISTRTIYLHLLPLLAEYETYRESL